MKLLGFSELARLHPRMVVDRDCSGSPWLLSLQVGEESVMLETTRGEPRGFKTLDAVFSVVQEVASREGVVVDLVLRAVPED